MREEQSTRKESTKGLDESGIAAEEIFRKEDACLELRGLLGTDPPRPHPRILLALPSSGVVFSFYFGIDSTIP